MNNGAFGEHFPYTNFHDLNLDWIIGIIKDFSDNYQGYIDAVNSKINKPQDNPNGNPNQFLMSNGTDFPEWVPSSYILEGISEIVDQATLNHYITPQMFGAVGDGTTDDTQAFRDAIAYSVSHNHIPICIISNYFITETIEVPRRVSFFCFTNAETKYSIFLHHNISVGFDCVSSQNYFHNINIIGENNNYIDATGILIRGDSSGNADTFISGGAAVFLNKGVECQARNLYVYDVTFSHDRYGIHINIPIGRTGVRGIVISDCRFHGIGEEFENVGGVLQEMLISGNTSSILLDADNQSDAAQESDIVIRNCLSDQSGTFVTGKAKLCLITGCYVVSWQNPSIIIEGGAGVIHPRNAGNWLISNCQFYGLKGTDGAGVYHANTPANFVTISHYGRITISGCSFSNADIPFKVFNNSTDISILNNVISSTNSGFLLEIYGTSDAVLNGNINQTNADMKIVKGDATATIYEGNNHLIANYYDTPVVINPLKPITSVISNRNSGDAFPEIQKYEKFYVRRSDSETAFEVTHVLGSYYTSTVHITSAGAMEYIKVDSSTYTISLMRSTSGAAPAQLTVPIVVMFKI